MNFPDFTEYREGQLIRESNLPFVDSNVWVYLLDQRTYLKVLEMNRGWSVIKCKDLKHSGKEYTQLRSSLNAQRAHRIAAAVRATE